MLHSSKRTLLTILLILITTFFIIVTLVNPSFLSPFLFFVNLSDNSVSPPLIFETVQVATSATPSMEPLAIDYTELIRCAKTYDGQRMQIAVRVGSAENRQYTPLCIFDRVNYYLAEEGHPTGTLKVYLDWESAIPCVPGEYYIIEGLWNYGFDEPYLSKAIIISDGEPAKGLALKYQSEWESERQKLSKTVPLTDFLVLNEQVDQLSGAYVRTAVTIARISEITIAERPIYNLNINSERTGELLGTVSLDGCTPEIQALCQEGTSVIVGGYLHKGSKAFSIENCYIETIGESAQTEVDTFIAQHKLNYEQKKQDYIADCTPLDYDAVLQHPENFQKAPLACSGTVDEISDGDPLSASFIIRLDSQPERRVDVSYSHGAIGDASIILGSSVTVYGSVFDVYYPEDANGVKKEALPMFIAKYADYQP